jgi:hypothetical protein
MADTLGFSSASLSSLGDANVFCVETAQIHSKSHTVKSEED